MRTQVGIIEAALLAMRANDDEASALITLITLITWKGCAGGTHGPIHRACGPMSRVVSLYHA